MGMKIKEITQAPRTLISEEIEKLPSDQVYTTEEIGKIFKVGTSTLRHMTSALKDNVYKVGTFNKWGSKKAIKALIQHLSGEVK